MPELKPCPFCGKPVFRREDGLHNESFTQCQDQECAGSMVWDCFHDKPIPASMWNRRTPNLTEAHARLKALEEELRAHSFVCTKCGASWRDSGGGSDLCTACGYLGVDCGGQDKWADEIAAIRGKLGAE